MQASMQISSNSLGETLREREGTVYKIGKPLPAEVGVKF